MDMPYSTTRGTKKNTRGKRTDMWNKFQSEIEPNKNNQMECIYRSSGEREFCENCNTINQNCKCKNTCTIEHSYLSIENNYSLLNLEHTQIYKKYFYFTFKFT